MGYNLIIMKVQKITCPHCGHKFESEVDLEINVSRSTVLISISFGMFLGLVTGAASARDFSVVGAIGVFILAGIMVFILQARRNKQ